MLINVPSVVLAKSSFAIGLSLTLVIVKVTSATSVPPSPSLISYSKLSEPK